MGITPWLWFFPLNMYQGKPKGNGIDWGEKDEDQLPSTFRGNNSNINNINDEAGNNINNNKNIELVEKLNEDKEMDKSDFSNMRNNDVTGISDLHRNQHGSMSSLYQ